VQNQTDETSAEYLAKFVRYLTHELEPMAHVRESPQHGSPSTLRRGCQCGAFPENRAPDARVDGAIIGLPEAAEVAASSTVIVWAPFQLPPSSRWRASHLCRGAVPLARSR